MIIYFSEDLQRRILELPRGIQARYVHLTQRMLTFGPNLGMPHSLPLGKGLFELRMKSTEGIGRVFYASLSRRMDHHAARLREEVPEDAWQRTEDRAGTFEGGPYS